MRNVWTVHIRASCLALAALALVGGCTDSSDRNDPPATEQQVTITAFPPAAPPQIEPLAIEDLAASPAPDTTPIDTPAPAEAAPETAAETETETGTAAPAPDPAAPEGNFSFDTVRARAKALAGKAYEAPPAPPEAATDLTYDQYRRIEFRRDAAIWSGEGQDVRLLLDPRGYLFEQDVRINLVANGRAVPRPYDPADFNFFDLPLPAEVQQTLGLSGFRVVTPLNWSGKYDEVVSFRGASFFRALGTGTVYGASARGLSIGTASPDGEEFPYFSEFWLAQPQPGSDTVEIYALLDGRSLTGAYKFTVEPGPETVVDVEATLYPRREVTGVGIAPVTSMYHFSPHDLRKQSRDFRPAVHDSEGLSIHMANGEWAWRPLINPQALQVSVLAGQVPRGFGLIQRKRHFDQYSDIEAGYEDRPNVWIEPGGGWDNGQLTLVEIPTGNEYNDNIVVFWRPSQAWKKGEAHEVSYRMRWGLMAPAERVITVSATRAGQTPGGERDIFVLDFEAADASLLEGAEASISASSGTIMNPIVRRRPETGALRLTFEFEPDGTNVSELRAFLTRAGEPVTETWLYRWRPA